MKNISTILSCVTTAAGPALLWHYGQQSWAIFTFVYLIMIMGDRILGKLK